MAHVSPVLRPTASHTPVLSCSEVPTLVPSLSRKPVCVTVSS